MSSPELVPADGDPTDDPAAAELAPAQRHRLDDADTPRTEYPVPESFPSSGTNGTNS
jgi:hypothetical protein